MGEEAITSVRQKALGDATILLDLAITRSRGSSLLDGRTEELVRGCRKAANQELGQFAEPYGVANGDVHKEASMMWTTASIFSRGSPSPSPNSLLHVIDRYLTEEAELRKLQSEKQTILETSLPISAGH
jgi:hypothetical protein